MENEEGRITTFVQTLLEYSNIKFYSKENLLVEALTFVLLTCGINIQTQFQLLHYQLQNNYIPWGFSAPKNKDVKFINSVDLFKSLINVFLRLDVNRKVLQCYQCRTKCSCEVVATFKIEEIELFTVQDPIQQVVDSEADNLMIKAPVITNPIIQLSTSFMYEDELKYERVNQISFQNDNVMLNGFENAERKSEDGEATLSQTQNSFHHIDNFDAWNGHNDDGIPLFNYVANFTLSERHDFDLQLDCKV